MRRASRTRETAGRVPPAPAGWRRYLRIGPGLIVAILLAVVLVIFNARMHAPQGPPIVERQVQPSAHPGAGSYPEVQFLLDRRDRLELTPEQATKLEAIQKEWEGQSAADRKTLIDETQGFEQFLRAQKGQTPMPEIQRRAAAVSALSGAVAASRYQAWQKALGVLTQEQRARAEAMRKAEAKPWKAR